MKNVYFVAAMFSSMAVIAEPLCWNTKVDEKTIAALDVKPHEIVEKDNDSYLMVCIDFEDAAKKLEYAGGGGCGGSSRCGSNFLVLNDIILELTNPFPFKGEYKPWKTLIEQQSEISKINIAKDLKSAQLFLEKRQVNEKTIMSEDLQRATESVLEYELGIKNIDKIDLLNQYKQQEIDKFKGLQVDIEKLSGFEGHMLTIKGKMNRQ